MKKYRWGIMLCAWLCTAFCMPSRAEEINGYSKEIWDQLMDNTLHYHELEDLVHNFNPDIQLSQKTLNSGLDDIDQSLEELEFAKLRAKGMQEEAKENGDIENYQLYTVQMETFKASVSGLTKSRESITKSGSAANQGLKKAEQRLTYAARTLMISYQQTKLQKEILQTALALREDILRSAEAYAQAGLATQESIQTAKVGLSKAKQDIENLTANETQLKRSLIMLCGWKADAEPNIENIDTSDLIAEEKLNALDLEEDTKKAIGNHAELIPLRSGNTSKTESVRIAHEAQVNQTEDKLRTVMEERYQNITQNRTALEAAQIASESARQKTSAADIQLRLGVISQMKHNEIRLSESMAKLSEESARLSLLLSVLEYEDAINGNAVLE